ncbi:MAG TPA: Trm112 family protein [Proteobacteria bacterium]|nr:Trm112 family protein [Pseudomonadota bacterium]
MGDPYDPEFVKILCCPKCRGEVEPRRDAGGFVCHNCKLLFRVQDGIPNFLIDEAVPWEEPSEGGSDR